MLAYLIIEYEAIPLMANCYLHMVVIMLLGVMEGSRTHQEVITVES